jgi:hypothetical protein
MENFQIPSDTMEMLLSKLNDMGFTDRQANINLLEFHHKYKEGLDEVTHLCRSF